MPAVHQPRASATGRTRTPRGRPAAVLALALLLAACTSGPAGTSGSDDAAAPSRGGTAEQGPAASGELPRPDHVVVVVFENEDATDVVGSSDAPYLTSLARSGADFTDAHGEVHPSQPNYLALFSGSTQGVEDNDCPVELTGDNLASQLLAAGETFVGYAEGLPRPGYTGCESGDYARKHNPWVNWTDLPDSVNQPFSAWPTDHAQLPTVAFVVPDLCNDMHDCGVDVGDAWAEDNLGPYVEWATAHDSLLVMTFDEDSGTDDNHIATVVAGAGVVPTRSDQRIDHYDLLRTIEDMYGLEPLGEAADAEPITGIWAPAGG
ncbi:alkaline phosphatase family protein [Geodermatophilus sp. SYSU D00705]